MADESSTRPCTGGTGRRRPQEVLGQDHVVRALTGAIREGRLHHAFLFCGPRGTGKTSTARILAKMVNCEQGPTAEPCGVCSQCVAIREGTHLDVVEIDAASHGGVEDARELREKAPTAPVQGREKVYIIDEAQRLSREAFDALLKVFEEPPPGVRFVLATTEPHKMPATIVGRCAAVRLPAVRAGDALRAAADDRRRQEGASLTRVGRPRDRAAGRGVLARRALAARPGRVLGGATIDDDVVRALLGAPRGEVQHELADSVAVGDARGVVRDRRRGWCRTVRTCATSPPRRLAHFRNLLLVKTAPGQQDLLDVPDDAYDAPAHPGREVHARPSSRGSSRCCWPPRTTCGGPRRRGSRSSWRWSAPRMPETDPTPAGLVARLERLERLAQLDPGGGRAHGGRRRSRRRSGQPGRRRRAPVETVEPPVVDEAPAAAAPSVDPAPSERRTSEAGSAEAGTAAAAARSRCRCRRPPTPAASTSPCSGVPGLS